MDTKENNLDTLRELYQTQNLAVLSTQKDGQPYASLVAFSVSKDLKHFFFLTPTDTRKYDNLLSCDRVALLIHSAANTADDFHTAISVTALGKAMPVEDSTALLPPYLERHPQLADFSRSPTTAMISVRIDSHIMVNRFQNVVELKMDQ